MVTADAWNGSGPPGLRPMYRLFSFHQKTKTKQKKKHKKWNELTPRYQTGETEVWAICTAPLLGTRNKQALSGVHETLHSAGIAFFGQTAWGSNPHKGLNICNICFLSILYTVPFDFGDPTCPLTAVKCLFLKLKKKIALSKWLVLIDYYIELKSPKLLLYSIFFMNEKREA